MKLNNCKQWAGGLLGFGVMATLLSAGDIKKKQPAPDDGAESKQAKAHVRPDPKPLSRHVERGLAYLSGTQHKNGGWGQGGGWRTGGNGGGRVEGANVEDPPDIGNTAVALLSFLRSGYSFTEGEYAKTMTKAADFLFKEIAKNDDDTLYVTAVRGTQLQSKIGAYVDTFLAALVLSELKGELPDKKMEKRRAKLLAHVIKKIETNQNEQGTFQGNAGWAATLSQGLCSKALNRAWSAGAPVSDEALRRDQANNAVGVVAGSTTIAASAAEPSSAGVDIYRYSSKLGGLQELNQNKEKRLKNADKVLKDESASDKEKKQARAEISLLEENEKQTEAAFEAVGRQMDNESFVAGYGNNGGEEFLSYMNLSEAMFAKGGKEWVEWDKKVAKMVNGAQNEDGSWAGQHCITGRIFCTSTALLTLMADRMPLPEGADEE